MFVESCHGGPNRAARGEVGSHRPGPLARFPVVGAGPPPRPARMPSTSWDAQISPGKPGQSSYSERAGMTLLLGAAMGR